MPKIIEYLKELPLLEKRMTKNTASIQQYASAHSQEELPFKTDEAQKTEVMGFIQANYDLATRYEKIKLALSRTNNTVKVVIGGDTKTITEWIGMREKTSKLLALTLAALNTSGTDARMRTINIDKDKPFFVKRLYDESIKNDMTTKLMEKVDNIDATLEIINATTDVIETV